MTSKTLLLLTVLLASCAATPHYRNPGHKTDQDWNADVAECQSKSWGANGVYQHHTFDYCMKGKGWVRSE